MQVLASARDEFEDSRYLRWRQIAPVLGKRASQMLSAGEVESLLSTPQEHMFPDDDRDRWDWQALRAHQAEAVPALLKLAAEGKVAGKRGALFGLGEMQVRETDVVSRIVERLKDPRAVVRAAAAEALAKYADRATAALPALREAVKDDYLTVRHAAEEAIAAIDGDAAP